ncbi:MAG: zinc ABC transporter substrate-binding protein [Candidatus Zixiibacteriota bacterium]
MIQTKFRWWLALMFTMAAVIPTRSPSAEPLRVVASTSTMAYFAKQIGGDLVDVEAIAAGNRDLHYVEVLPSHMLKLRNADLFVIVGLELDMWWEPMVAGSRNSGLTVVDCSKGVEPLEVPTFKADARHGDLHRFGNPHYWLDPDNVPVICTTITDAMMAADPDHADAYTSGRDRYLTRFSEKVETWRSQRPALGTVRFVAYHNSWPYLCKFFGCHTVGFVEEFPGVAPSPSHLARLIGRITAERIPAVVYEPFHDPRIPNMLAEKTGCRAIELSESIGGLEGTDTYEALMDSIIAALLPLAEKNP